MSSKQQILEPITSIVKLALLYFKSDSTKISFYNYGIYYDDPSDNIFMYHAFNRKIRGDSREDISVLNGMIVNYLDWYIINNEDSVLCSKFVGILKHAINGLKKIKQTYVKTQNLNLNSNVTLTLQYYINLIVDVLENIEKYKNVKVFKEYTSYIECDQINLVDVKKIREIWSDDEINTLYSDLEFCFDKNHSMDYVHAKVKGLNDILQKKDCQFCDTVKKSLGGQCAA